MKICSACNRKRPITEFGNDKHTRDGKTCQCKDCRGLRKKDYRLKNRDVCNAYNREYHKKHKEEISNRRKRLYASRPKENRNAAHQKWAANNKQMVCFIAAKKRARRKRATPLWLSEVQWQAIKNIYLNCPIGQHVDHIIPLLAVDKTGHQIACGLHVPWNLQYLSASENSKKRNRL